jgi:hypothetical protein
MTSDADESANQVESSVKFFRRLSVKFQPNTDPEFASEYHGA